MRRIYLAAVLMTVVPFSAISCRKESVPRSTASVSTDWIAIDVGFDATQKDANAITLIAAETLPELATTKDEFVLRAVDNGTGIITTASPLDEDAASSILKQITNNVVPGTNLCNYMETLADAYSNKKVIVIFFTDGLDDGKPHYTEKRLNKAASRLYANPNVLKIIIVGLCKDGRPGWKGFPEMLAPLKSKLSVIPRSDMSQERVLEEVKAARTQTSHR